MKTNVTLKNKSSGKKVTLSRVFSKPTRRINVRRVASKKSKNA